MASIINLSITDFNDLIIKAGNTLNSQNSLISVIDNDGSVNLSSQYSSGYLRVTDRDGTLMLSFTTSNNSLVFGNGYFYLSSSSTNTNIGVKPYQYNLTVNSSTSTFTLSKGYFNVI